MTAIVKFDINAVRAKIDRHLSAEVQSKLDLQVLKDSNFYCPQDVGTLQDSGILYSVIGSGVLEWRTPYARAQYYEMPNKATDKNPNARMKWFEAAKAAKKKDWARLANAEYHR